MPGEIQRIPGTGWLALLGALVLIPLPIGLTSAGVEASIATLVLFGLSGVIGAAIILAGRPLRD